MPILSWPPRRWYHSPGDEPSLNLPPMERYCSRAKMKPNRAPPKINPASEEFSQVIECDFDRYLTECEVVALLKTERVVDFAHTANEAVGRL